MSAHATYQDVLNVPEHLTAELIDGAVFLSRRGSPRQAWCRSILGTSLYRVPGWFVLWKPELHLDANVFVPELAGWRRECWLDDDVSDDVTPDWVCDIVTPWEGAFDPRIKLSKYAPYGIGHAWIVDIPGNSVEVRRLERGVWIELAVFETAKPFRAEPFLGIEIDLGSIWASSPAP
jgi:hypothetical protein